MRLTALARAALWIGLALSWASLPAAPKAPPEFALPQQRLFYYAAENDAEGIRQAIADGAVVDAPRGAQTGEEGSALEFAALFNSGEAARTLIEAGATINYSFNDTPIRPAFRFGNMAVAPLIYAEILKLPPEERIRYQKVALHEAVYHGQLEALRFLVDQGAARESGYFKEDQDPRMLAAAIHDGNLEMVRYFVEDLDLNLKHDSAAEPPVYAAAWANQPEILRYLISHGAHIDERYQYWSPLGIAARYGHSECVIILLDAGAQPVADNGHPDANQADLGGQLDTLKIFEDRGLQSTLWEVWQEEYKRPPERYESAVDFKSGLSATLLEGEWEMPAAASNGGSVRLAVLADPAGATLGDFITADLSTAAGIELVERTSLDAILAEKQLDRAQLIAGSGLGAVAHLLGADGLILINGLTVDKDKLLQLRLVDTRLGLVINVRFTPQDDKSLPEFAEHYAAFVAGEAERLRSPLDGLIPVALVNVRAGQPGPDAAQAARQTRAALEYAIANTPGLLLLERASLDALLQENQIAGQFGLNVKASSALVDARIDWDSAKQRVERLVVRINRNGEEETISLENDGASLQEVLQAAAAAIAGQESAPKSEEGDLTADREALAAEANWLLRYKLYPEALAAMQNALALGADRPQDWRLYELIVRSVISRLLVRQSTYDDATNRQILALELEWLRANRNFLRQYLADPSIKIPGNVQHDSSFDIYDFYQSLKHFAPITLRRRYTAELAEIENQYVALLDECFIPFFADYDPEDRVKNKAMSRGPRINMGQTARALSSSLFFLNQQSPETIERLAKALFAKRDYRGTSSFIWNITEPRTLPGGWEQMDAWIREYADGRMVLDYYDARMDGDYLNSFARTRQWTDWYQLRDDLMAYMKDADPYYRSLAEILAIRNNPQDRVYQIMGVNYYPPQNRAATLAEVPHRLAAYTEPRPIEAFYDPADLTKALKQYQSARADLPADGDQAESLDKAIAQIESRLYNLKTEADEDEVPVSPIRFWHPRQFVTELDNPYLNQSLFYRESDKCWYVAVRHSQRSKPDEIYIFKIDEQTGKTTWDHYVMPKDAPTNGDLLVSDDYYVLSYEGMSVIDRHTAQVTVFDDIIAYANGNENVFIQGNDIYFIGQPLVEERRALYTWLTESSFLKRDLETGALTTIFSSRRNPPETPLDKPFGQQEFRYQMDKSRQKFLFRHQGFHEFDIASGVIRPITEDEYDALRRDGYTQCDDRLRGIPQGESGYWRLSTLSSSGEIRPDLAGDGRNFLYSTKIDDETTYRIIRIEPRDLPTGPEHAKLADQMMQERRIHNYGSSEHLSVFTFQGAVNGLLLLSASDLRTALEKSPAYAKP